MSLTNIGTTVEVSAALPATEDQAGYEALSYTEVEGVSSIGEIGPVYEVLTHVDVKDGITRKAVGGVDYGSAAMQYRVIAADAGQGIIDTALNAQDTISLKITRSDGLVQYAQVIITSAPTAEGSSTTVYTKSSNVELTSAIVEV